jgi:hypothetical protein
VLGSRHHTTQYGNHIPFMPEYASITCRRLWYPWLSPSMHPYMHIACYTCHIHRNLDSECYTQNHCHIDISLLRMAHSRRLQPLCRSYVTQENSRKFHTQPKSLISYQKAVVPSAIESTALDRQGPQPRADRPCIQPRVWQRHQQGKMIPPVVLTFPLCCLDV